MKSIQDLTKELAKASGYPENVIKQMDMQKIVVLCKNYNIDIRGDKKWEKCLIEKPGMNITSTI